MSQPVNIVVFTGNPSYSVRQGIVDIDRAIAGLNWLIVIHAPKKTPGQLIKSQWRNLRRNGWRWIPYQAGDIWRRLTGGGGAAVKPGLPGYDYTAKALAARPNVRLMRVADIHAPATLAAVRAFAPDLGLSLAAPILRAPLFSIPRRGTINLHKGKLPEYRGMPPAFWELWNGEASVGCSVHWVDDKLDTGAILKEAAVTRAKFSTLKGLQLTLDEMGAGLMRQAVGEILAGKVQERAQPPFGKTYRKPKLAETAQLERRLRGAARPHDPALKRGLKQAGYRLGFWLWRAGLGRLMTPRITVMLYHRVSDDARDNLTVGIEQFDRQMALLRKHCEILPLDRVLASHIVPKSAKPLVAVTFDDGYLDNYAHAAPILKRHGIPAAFFVSTGIVGRDGRFPHDLRRGNPFIPVMNWDHLREMQASGFTIGSHTVSHMDIAAEPEAEVRAELAESRDHLARELGVTEPLFAYPYGGRDNITPERLQLVKEAGYKGCLAAYGGVNIATVDPYNLLRRGIHWEFSDAAFLFKCLGLR